MLFVWISFFFKTWKTLPIFEKNISYLISDVVVATNGYSQSVDDTFLWKNRLNSLLPVVGLSSTKVNHNAKFCIFKLSRKLLQHLRRKAFNISQNPQNTPVTQQVIMYVPNIWIQGFVSWWRHKMETFSALLTLCAGNSPVTGEFPSRRPVTRSFDVFFDLCLE